MSDLLIYRYMLVKAVQTLQKISTSIFSATDYSRQHRQGAFNVSKASLASLLSKTSFVDGWLKLAEKIHFSIKTFDCDLLDNGLINT